MAKRTCSIDECARPAVARGWCNTHYLRWHRHGDPMTTLPQGTKPKCRLDLFTQWTNEEAWLLGLIWADGCLSRGRRRHKRIIIVSTDKELADHASSITGAPAIRRIPAPPRKPYYKVTIGAEVVVARAVAIGLTERKSLACSFPDVPADMRHHFVRGFFDGDGSVGLYSGDSHPPLLRSSFFGTWDALNDLNGWLVDADVSPAYLRPQVSIFRLEMSHWASLHLAEFMYRDGGPCLTRKRDLFAEGALRRHQRRRQQFVSTWLNQRST